MQLPASFQMMVFSKLPRVSFLLMQGGHPLFLSRCRFCSSSPASNLCPATEWCLCVWRCESPLCQHDRQLQAELKKSTWSCETTVELMAYCMSALFIEVKPPARIAASRSKVSIKTAVLAKMKYERKIRKTSGLLSNFQGKA